VVVILVAMSLRRCASTSARGVPARALLGGQGPGLILLIPGDPVRWCAWTCHRGKWTCRRRNVITLDNVSVQVTL